jgi:hypothetical protein
LVSRVIDEKRFEFSSGHAVSRSGGRLLGVQSDHGRNYELPDYGDYPKFK